MADQVAALLVAPLVTGDGGKGLKAYVWIMKFLVVRLKAREKSVRNEPEKRQSEMRGQLPLEWWTYWQSS